ncbi:hypothetical protein V1478_017026 [Vespula squamosa]|uniref:Uncharacterized protein n=1 Tax=Vespula squamosa TaxID=30214 RepID=A0ABD1ZY83_VESSQ
MFCKPHPLVSNLQTLMVDSIDVDFRWFERRRKLFAFQSHNRSERSRLMELLPSSTLTLRHKKSCLYSGTTVSVREVKVRVDDIACVPPTHSSLVSIEAIAADARSTSPFRDDVESRECSKTLRLYQGRGMAVLSVPVSPTFRKFVKSCDNVSFRVVLEPATLITPTQQLLETIRSFLSFGLCFSKSFFECRTPPCNIKVSLLITCPSSSLFPESIPPSVIVGFSLTSKDKELSEVSIFSGGLGARLFRLLLFFDCPTRTSTSMIFDTSGGFGALLLPLTCTLPLLARRKLVNSSSRPTGSSITVTLTPPSRTTLDTPLRDALILFPLLLLLLPLLLPLLLLLLPPPPLPPPPPTPPTPPLYDREYLIDTKRGISDEREPQPLFPVLHNPHIVRVYFANLAHSDIPHLPSPPLRSSPYPSVSPFETWLEPCSVVKTFFIITDTIRLKKAKPRKQILSSNFCFLRGGIRIDLLNRRLPCKKYGACVSLYPIDRSTFQLHNEI